MEIRGKYFAELSLLVVLSLITSSECLDYHTRIGNYSELNPAICGRSRKSLAVEQSCFKYHNEGIPSVTAARDMAPGEAPWVVAIGFIDGNKVNWCTGSIIAKRWILTAAHCLKATGEIRIYVGYDFRTSNYKDAPSYKVKGSVKHPNASELYDDIALIEMYSEALPGMQDDYINQNSICLPERNIVNKKEELVMVAGYGQPGSAKDWKLPVQIGNQRLFYFSWNHKGTLYLKFIGHRTRICKGDSGAPIWQYYMGVAVQIGLIFRADGDREDGCLKPDGRGEGRGARVSKYIDWISSVTGLH